MKWRAGVTLVECVIASTLGSLLLGILAATLLLHERLARAESERIARAEALRTPAILLRAELRTIDPVADVRAISSDSIALRMFRGVGAVCAAADDTLVIAYRGARTPDPFKDSLVLVGADRDTVMPIAGVLESAPVPNCVLAAPSRPLRLRIPGRPDAARLALIFESGSYFFSGNALRYRRGLEGRQPLTGDWLENASAFSPIRAPADSALLGVSFRMRGRRQSFQNPVTSSAIDFGTSFLNRTAWSPVQRH